MLSQKCFYVCVQLDSLRLDSGKSQLTEHIVYLEEQLRKHRLHVEQFQSNSTAVRQMKAQVCHLCDKEHVLKIVFHIHIFVGLHRYTYTQTNMCVCVCARARA